MHYRWDPPYPSHRHWTGPAADPGLRASDAERNEVAERLSRHFADGRLDQAEFKVRLDKAMGATTRGDLQGLFDDLPRLADEPPPPRSRRRRLVPLLVIVALVAVVGDATFSMVHVPWLLLALVGVFLWYRSDRRAHRSAPEIGR